MIFKKFNEKIFKDNLNKCHVPNEIKSQMKCYTTKDKEKSIRLLLEDLDKKFKLSTFKL